MSQIKCLAVEDEAICQYIIKKHLEDLKCDVDIAADATAAYRLLEKNSYDIIFMDIGLPDKNGIELTKEIRSHLKITCPIVAVTGHVLAKDSNECLQSGMNHVLHKPVSQDQIEQLVKSLT